MGVIVSFNYDAWIARYPEFSAVTSASAEQYFAEATIYHANNGAGPVATATLQSALLNMLTAHIAWLSSPRDENGRPDSSGSQLASPLVGRISNASEGSVSVQTEFGDSTPGTVAWFNQTQYGASYWQATRQFRTMRYRPGPCVNRNTFFWGGR